VKSSATPLLVVLCLAFGLPLHAASPANKEEPANKGEAKTKPAEETLPIEELRAFAEIFSRVKSDYVKKVSDKVLLEHAISGMVHGLDPHSSYLNSEEYQELQEGTTGVFGGLGIEVGMEDGFVKVISPIDDTPAQKAGLKPGDLITKLDDKSVKDLTLDEAVKIMRGEPGTDITLTVVREGESKPLVVVITRAIIKVKSVKERMLAEGFGYLRLTTFQARSQADLVSAMDRLKEQAKGKLKGLVLDLRNNPGGVLNTAVAVSDSFLEGGLIVYTEGRLADSETRFEAGPGDILDGAPLVVLVNEGSASASEIVAGALQDHKRAVIIGSQTFGKGSVQTVIPVGKNGALKLTTALYFTPSGRSIQAEGIKPDIQIANIQVNPKESKSGSPHVKESDLARHLDNGKKKPEGAKNGTEPKAEEPKKGEEPTKTEEPPLVESDFVLNEALNLLKGLAILSGTHEQKAADKEPIKVQEH
jgi:carboxyl-terminal processing protease